MNELGNTSVAQIDEATHVDQAASVKQFLLDNPSFFKQHPDLLNTLEIPDARKGSISLVEMQNEQLRKKVKQLSTKLSQLIEIASENQQIYEVFAALNLKLLKATSLEEVKSTLSEVLKDKLGLSAAVIHLFSGESALPEIQQRLIKDKRFKNSDYFFGRLSENEKQLVFAEQVAASSALVLLGEDQAMGLLAIGSKDESHFTPDMDTLLINQLRAFLNAVIPELV